MRIVIKIGTSSLTLDNETGINRELIAKIVNLVANLRKEGHQVLLVSSGAVGLGGKRLGWIEKPSRITLYQAAASVGQILLARVYEECFAPYKITIGQVLLTRLGMQQKEHYLSARMTLTELLKLGVVPIINENDVVADEEIKFSDNDYLAALVSELVSAEHLFILTDTEGLFTSDPRFDPEAKLISVVPEINAEVEVRAGQKSTHWGTGGMVTKIEAAKMATAFGTTVHILTSRHPEKVIEVLKGSSHGTTFLPRQNAEDARKAWLAYGILPKGKLVIDNGAFSALGTGRSLLPIGIKKVQGKFSRGQALEICYEEQEHIRVVAKGITKYDSEDLRKIKGRLSEEIESILGYSYGNSAIHRDDLVMLTPCENVAE
ncbi:MAG: glutamate 5-kinase [Candidatus Caenarcaniphilales bacterium]|nr:glutamate 5-kinase [Candidatus Caenarcaniphilales bacterium]